MGALPRQMIDRDGMIPVEFDEDVDANYVVEYSAAQKVQKTSSDGNLPAGVTAQMRTDGDNRYIFLMNFNDREVHIDLNSAYIDLLTERTLPNIVTLERYGVMVLLKC